MAEMTGFMNMTQIRKLTQDILKPIIQEIEVEMASMRKQSSFLKEQSAKTSLLSEKQAAFEEYISCNKEDIRNIKIRLEELNDEDIKNMLSGKKEFTAINLEIEEIKKQRAKFEEILLKQKKENDRMCVSFGKYQEWIDKKVDSINAEYLKLKEETLEMTKDVERGYQESKVKFQKLQEAMESHLEVNDKKYEVLELYLSEREEVKKKLVYLEQELKNYATTSDLDLIRKCQQKQLEMNKAEVTAILDEYIPHNIRTMFPAIESKVKQIDSILEEVSDIKNNVFESEQEIQTFKSTTQSLQSNFRQQFRTMNDKVSETIVEIKKDLNTALEIDQKQTHERTEFEKAFTKKLQIFVAEQNQQIYERINQETSNRMEERQKEDSEKINTQQKQLNEKCEEMREISDNIDKLLNSYNNRITKVRSDTEMFKEDIMKELRVINKMKQEYSQKFEDVGKVVASLTEILTIHSAVSFHESQFPAQTLYGSEAVDTKTDCQTAIGSQPQNPHQYFLSKDNQSEQQLQAMSTNNNNLATFNDGLIYQSTPYHQRESKDYQLSRSMIIYRRKQMEVPHLKKCQLTAVVNLIDRVYESYPYFDWAEGYRPSSFFKEQVLEGYNLQLEKYGSCLAINTLRQHSRLSNRQTGVDKKNASKRVNTSTTTAVHRRQSRYKDKRLQHHQTTTKSPEGLQLQHERNSTLMIENHDSSSFKLNNASFNNMGDTINENIEIIVSRNSPRFSNNFSSSMAQEVDNGEGAKKTMRTIHEVHPKDHLNNRFVLSGLANRNSKDSYHYQTLDGNVPQSAEGKRRRYANKSMLNHKSKNDINVSSGRYDRGSHRNNHDNFLTSRSSRRNSAVKYQI